MPLLRVVPRHLLHRFDWLIIVGESIVRQADNRKDAPGENIVYHEYHVSASFLFRLGYSRICRARHKLSRCT